MPTAPPPTQPPVAPPPTKAPEKPYPTVPESKRAEADKVAAAADPVKAKAEALYKEANEAKKAGDSAKWQSKLKEMRSILENLKDQWNDFVATMPVSRDYDTEDVAKHYFGPQSGRVQAALKLLAASKSDEK